MGLKNDIKFKILQELNARDKYRKTNIHFGNCAMLFMGKFP